MANYKLVLDDDIKDDFILIAIHCSVEAFKMAYLLNRFVGLKLERRRIDLDFSKKGLEVTFPWFEFEDTNEYTTYDLLANKCKSKSANTVASGGLFGDGGSEELLTEFLLPELKKVDFLLKITTDFEQVPMRKLLIDINDINEVISAYQIELDELRSRNNLIFD